MHDNLESYRHGTAWKDSTRHGKWKAVFDGYGRVGVAKADSNVLTLAPQVSDRASETHAALGGNDGKLRRHRHDDAHEDRQAVA